MFQETQTGVLYQPRGVGCDGEEDERQVQEGGDICIQHKLESRLLGEISITSDT